MKLTLLLLASTANSEESEGVSLLQTLAHVHTHGHSNATGINPHLKGKCTADDWSSKCWPGYKFSDFLPAGCVSQGMTKADITQKISANGMYNDHGMGRGHCDQLITKPRVDAFSKSLLKFAGGCTTGEPNSYLWMQEVDGSVQKLWYANPRISDEAATDEMRAEAVEFCMKFAEENEKCAGANVVRIRDEGCRCYGGVTALRAEDTSLSCSVKSRPVADNPRTYDASGRKDAVESIKETKELGSCSKGWWVMAGGLNHGTVKEPGSHAIETGALRPYPDGANPALLSGWSKTENPAYVQSGALHPDSRRYYANGPWAPLGRDALSKTGSPADCAKAVKQCMDEGAEHCKDPITGGPPKGASMIAAAGDSQNWCKAWFGDVSRGKGAPVGGGKAPEGALWPGEARFLCIVDDNDPEEGTVLVEGAKKSGKYTPGGPKEKKTKESKEAAKAEKENFVCDLCKLSENDFDPKGRMGKCQRIHDKSQKNAKRCEKLQSRDGVLWGCCPSEACKSARDKHDEDRANRDAAKKALADAKAAQASRAELKSLKAELKAARAALKAAKAARQSACGSRPGR